MSGHDTVRGLIEAGRLAPRKRVSQDALWTAVEWLEAYEGDPDDDSGNLVELATVAAWLRREALRRGSRS